MLQRRVAMVISLMALLLTLAPAAASAASGPITWGAPVAADAQPPWGDPVTLTGLSCLSTPLCVAVDGRGRVVSTTDPTGGTSDWHIASLPGVSRLSDVSCANGTFCVAVGTDLNSDNFIATSSDPTGGASAWHVEPISITALIEGVSCASNSFCALVDNAGNVWTSSTPAAAASWTKTDIDGSHPLNAISCPSASLCMAVDNTGNAIYSTDPTDSTPTWTVTDVDGTRVLTAVSCITSGECWIADGQGNVLHSNGATYSSGWTSVAVGDPATTGAWEQISCSGTTCAAVDDIGSLAASNSALSSQASDWTIQPVDPGHHTLPVDCIPNSCVAVDVSGNALTASDPTGTWTTTLIDGASGLDGLACPSVSLCVAGDDAGGVLSSTEPAGGAGAWQRALVDSGGRIFGVACPSVSLCVLGDDRGDILTSSNPAGGAGAWTSPVSLTGGTPLLSISCPTVSLCAAVDGFGGDVWVSTNPTGGAGAWSSAPVDSGHFLEYVSCPSASLCVAVDDNGSVLSSTDPAGGASAWSAPVSVDPGHTLSGVSCANGTLCVAVDDNGTAFVSTDPTGSNWLPAVIDPNGDGFAGVACRPGPTCVAVDFDGNAVASADPAAGASTWSAPENIDAGSMNGFNAVNCSPGLLCVAVDVVGNVVVGTPPPPSASGSPTITGTAAIGQQLTEAHAGWTGDPVSFAYQWEDCDASGGACTAIPGATAQSYAVQASDAGHTLRVSETAANAGGSGMPAVSAATLAVPSVPSSSPGPSAPSVSKAPTISGAAIVGHRLHASTGVWLGTAPLSYAYQWQACRRSCTDLAGATGSTYMLRKGDRGARVRVEVTASNVVGRTSAVSATVGPVLTVKQIQTTLLHASVPHGRAARYATILASHGFTVAFAGLMPGKLRVVWKSGKVVVATGTLRFIQGGRHRLHLKLTAAGRRLLAAHAGKLTATVTFTPAGGQAMSFSERFSLR
ncbi:MAG: hypothetical protein ACTHMY_29190 [Solirubrobacteraceae bacterium]